MKTRTKIFYNYTSDDGSSFAPDIDRWVAETPGEVKDVSMAKHGNFGVVMLVLYEPHTTHTDWGPN